MNSTPFATWPRTQASQIWKLPVMPLLPLLKPTTNLFQSESSKGALADTRAQSINIFTGDRVSIYDGSIPVSRASSPSTSNPSYCLTARSTASRAKSTSSFRIPTRKARASRRQVRRPWALIHPLPLPSNRRRRAKTLNASAPRLRRLNGRLTRSSSWLSLRRLECAIVILP